MKITYRRSARTDLDAIANYYAKFDRDAAARVINDIEDSVATLDIFPARGSPIAGTALRRILSKRYRYIISYAISEERVEIVGVFRHQDRSF